GEVVDDESLADFTAGLDIDSRSQQNPHVQDPVDAIEDLAHHGDAQIDGPVAIPEDQLRDGAQFQVGLDVFVEKGLVAGPNLVGDTTAHQVSANIFKHRS